MGDQIAQYYENDPNAMMWREEGGDRREIGLYIGHCISEKLDIPRTSHGKTIIVSVASNIGVMEQGIQEEAGDQFLVISNDFANIPRLKGTVPLRSDARSLPFDDNTILCIVDVAGALWHQLGEDKLDSELIKKKSEHGSRMLRHYLQKLKPGGYLLTDDGFDKSTGQFIDTVLGGKRIDGFAEPILLGEKPFILRAYKKIG